ncbi:MAG: response regulator [Deltaproteobacteria bacterium]|nr:response regulator [Deltaproteobacteria bacterium]
MQVLLVDDEKELVSTLAERLSLRGIGADWAVSGEEALRMAERGTYDVAVIDVKMPKISGIELEKMLKKKFPKMKFIFMTGHGSENDYRMGSAEAGAKYYLVKPVDIQVLIQKMKQVLEEQGG